MDTYTKVIENKVTFEVEEERKDRAFVMVSLKLDEDLVKFLKKHNAKYQTKIKNILKAYKDAYEAQQR